MQNISLSLPSLGYKNYTHLVFSAGPLAPTSRIYPLGGERSLPLFSIRHDRTQGATIVSRNSFTLLGYGGARPVHVGTVRWAGQHEHRAWMERGVERKVGAVDEWMLPDSPEPDAKQRSRREGRRARILIDDEEYEWAHGPEKGLFVLSRCSFGGPAAKAAVFTPAQPSRLFSRGAPAHLVLNLEHVSSASMAEHLETLDTIILSLLVFSRMVADEASGESSA